MIELRCFLFTPDKFAYIELSEKEHKELNLTESFIENGIKSNINFKLVFTGRQYTYQYFVFFEDETAIMLFKLKYPFDSRWLSNQNFEDNYDIIRFHYINLFNQNFKISSSVDLK